MSEPEEKPPPAKRLSLKQRRFIDSYLGEANGNATEAARLAGYSARTYDGLRNIAHEPLTNPYVEAEISRRTAAAAMGADEVLARLASVARGSLRPFVELLADGGWRPNLATEPAGEVQEGGTTSS